MHTTDTIAIRFLLTGYLDNEGSPYSLIEMGDDIFITLTRVTAAHKMKVILGAMLPNNDGSTFHIPGGTRIFVN